MDKYELTSRATSPYSRETEASTESHGRKPEMERKLEPRGYEDESCTESCEDAKHHRIEDERRRRRIFSFTTIAVIRSVQEREIGWESEELGWRGQEEEFH